MPLLYFKLSIFSSSYCLRCSPPHCATSPFFSDLNAKKYHFASYQCYVFSYQSVIHYKKLLKNKGLPVAPLLKFLCFICKHPEKARVTTMFILPDAISDLIKSREKFRAGGNLIHSFIVLWTPLDVKSCVCRNQKLSGSLEVCFSVSIKMWLTSVHGVYQEGVPFPLNSQRSQASVKHISVTRGP